MTHSAKYEKIVENDRQREDAPPKRDAPKIDRTGQQQDDENGNEDEKSRRMGEGRDRRKQKRHEIALPRKQPINQRRIEQKERISGYQSNPVICPMGSEQDDAERDRKQEIPDEREARGEDESAEHAAARNLQNGEIDGPEQQIMNIGDQPPG